MNRGTRNHIVIITLLLIVGVVLFALTSRFNNDMSSMQIGEDGHTSHSIQQPSQLHLSNTDELEEAVGDTVMNSISSQLYAKNYENHTVLEREASIKDFKKVDSLATKYAFSTVFAPSNNTYAVTVQVINLAVNNYSIEIEEVTNGN